MNLIEQLGGYCIAKTEHKMPVKLLNIDYEQLATELLAYRRANGIFEMGDWVKANDGHFGFNELFKIDDFFADDDGINLAVLDDGDCYPLSCLTHATDEEVAAGHRL